MLIKTAEVYSCRADASTFDTGRYVFWDIDKQWKHRVMWMIPYIQYDKMVCNTWWWYMIRYDTIWYDMTEYDRYKIQYGTMIYDTVSYNSTRNDDIRHNTVQRYHAIWRKSMIWFGDTIRYDDIRYGTMTYHSAMVYKIIRYSAVRYDLMTYEPIHYDEAW